MRSFLKHFDIQYACASGLAIGLIVFFINLSSSLHMAFEAGFAQSILSFLIVGTNTGVFKALYKHTMLLSISIPTLFTTIMASIIHFLVGTPRLTLTVSVVFALALFHFSMLSILHTYYNTIDLNILFKRLVKK